MLSRGLFLKRMGMATLATVGLGTAYYGGQQGILEKVFKTRKDEMKVRAKEAFNTITQEHQAFLLKNNFIDPKANLLTDTKNIKAEINSAFFETSLLRDLKAFNVTEVFVTKDIFEGLCDSGCSLACVFKANDTVQLQTGYIHGGLTAALIDTFFATFGFILNDLKPVKSANLEVKYNEPLETGQEYMLICQVDKIEGSNCQLKSYIRNSQGQILCESTADFAVNKTLEDLRKRTNGKSFPIPLSSR